MTQDKLDIVVYGATGFVGKLTAAHLVAHAPDHVRIGLAGRSRQRLEDVRSRLGGRALDWPVIVADSQDSRALTELAEQTSVVATSVGPYARYGMPLVEACARTGTHYADLTGEASFVRESIDRYDAKAQRSGARIVHSAGFDSIPSDLGVLMLHEAVRAAGAGELEDTTLAVTGLRGGLSGGTLESMREQLEGMSGDPERRRQAADPYSLSPQRDKEPQLGRESDFVGVSRDEQLGQWVAPFVMAPANTRVVRRSNALQDWAYGRRFRYREVMAMGAGPLGLAKASAVTAGLAAFGAGMAFRPTRAGLALVLPKPGEGPSEQTRTNGYFRIEIHTRTSTGARYIGHVAAKGDPGYAATAVMFGESALSLALDGDRLPPRAGVLTTATGIGMDLVDRLRARQFTFAVESQSDQSA
jgi:short subunit dehydrogenase-like uncharacterized protein